MLPSSYCVRYDGRSAASMPRRALDELRLVARQRKDRHLHRRDLRVKPQHGALRLLAVGIDAALALVRVDQEREKRTIDAGRALDQQRRIVRLAWPRRRSAGPCRRAACARPGRTFRGARSIRARPSPTERGTPRRCPPWRSAGAPPRLARRSAAARSRSRSSRTMPCAARPTPRKRRHVFAVVGNEILELGLLELAQRET